MNNRLEEIAGKSLLSAAFGYLAIEQFILVILLVKAHGTIELWSLAVVSQFVSLNFIALVIYTTIQRLPAKRNAQGLEPRLTALAGTFALLVLAYLPPGHLELALRLIAMLLIIVGTALSIYCLLALGRSFSIMASARHLVTEGPYAIVRHPLYAAEAITTVGIIMAHFSIAAVLVGVLQMLLQFRRMQHEERVLRDAFPEYDTYAARVPMIIPGPLRAAVRPG
jgi:protein-S-isoprenylcysteine O-methyltransferase Ste14